MKSGLALQVKLSAGGVCPEEAPCSDSHTGALLAAVGLALALGPKDSLETEPEASEHRQTFTRAGPVSVLTRSLNSILCLSRSLVPKTGPGLVDTQEVTCRINEPLYS